jgi:uncharacterized protein (TIGR03000 family)
MQSLLWFPLFAAIAVGMRGGEPAAAQSQPATIVVQLPADAKLTVDDQVTKSTSATRRFLSPPLQAGKTFQYTFKAEFKRGGKTITISEKVNVRGGQETSVVLDYPEPRVPGFYGAFAPTDGYGFGGSDASFWRNGLPAVSSTIPNVASAFDQDPLKDAGPPGFSGPMRWSAGR